MTIHHDKMAYGRLAASREDLSEDKLAQMLKELNGTSAKDGEKNVEKPDGNNGKKGEN